MEDLFRKFAQRVAHVVGTSWSFLLALATIVIWGLTGPIFHFSDTWQLVINTGTTIVTFLMVFLIQNTQNRDAKAIHLKLDELLRANHDARNAMVHVEHLSDAELARLEEEFDQLSDQVRGVRRHRTGRQGGREAGKARARGERLAR